MDNLIEDKEVLNIGKKSFDVSNIPYYKKKVARRVWDEAVKEMGEDKDIDLEIFNDIIDVYGLYMLKHNFISLKRMFGFWGALKSLLKRYLVSIKQLRRLSEKEYNEFQEWAFFNITGKKKANLEELNQIQKLELMMLKEMEKLNLEPEQSMELLQIFLQETAGSMNISQLTPRVS